MKDKTISIWLLNTILKHNQSSVELLKQHAGKSFTIVTTIGLSISAVINDDGLLNSPNDLNELVSLHKLNNNNNNNHEYHEYNYTVKINIPLDIINYLINHDKFDAFKKISFVGDKHFGRIILEILSNLHLTGVYETKNPVTLLFINRMQCLINMLKSQFILSTNNIGHSVAEYIQYETQDVANGYEIENFCTQVDELKSRTELLAKRIQLLRSCLESSNLLQKELN